MVLELSIALWIAAVGMTFFYQFAEGHSYWRRIFKWAFYSKRNRRQMPPRRAPIE